MQTVWLNRRPWRKGRHSRAIERFYNLAVAIPVPALLIVLAFARARGMARFLLVATALLLFVATFIVSYFFYCGDCD